MTDEALTQNQDACTQPESYRFLESVAYFLFAVGPLVGNAVLVLLGAIASDFVLDPTMVLIAIPAFMFPFAFFQLFSGAVSDVYGRVPVIAGGLVLFAVGLFTTSYSTTIEAFALGNVISGTGFGFVNPVLLALLSDCALPEDIPKRMGIASALASLSVGLGPFIAGQMVRVGWRSYYLMFLLIVGIGFVAILVSRRPVRRVPEHSGVRVLASNLSVELRKPVVLLMLCAAFLVSLTYLGTLVWTSRGLTGAVSEDLVGILLLGGGVFGAIAGSLLGSVIRKYGYKFPILLGNFTIIAGLALLVLAGDITSQIALPAVAIALASVGWGGGILLPVVITYSQVLVPERRGVLAGSVTFAFFLGGALIPTAYEPLFHLGMAYLYFGILVISAVMLGFFLVLYRVARPVLQKSV
ncbi:MAG: MFS transporter [Candidatus Thorarchaeota archaeon]|jgi:DHA1 family bicyclomycin/chloramphenicol resistance-like MFS transporter